MHPLRIPCLRFLLLMATIAGLAVSVSGCRRAGHEGPGHRSQSLALTPHQEWSLGEQAYQEVIAKAKAEGKLKSTGPDAARIRNIGARIAKAAEIEPLQREINLRVKGYRFDDWKYALIESHQVNAFCLPGGKVAVFTGLLSVAETDDELATVMAHEIAHALAHHGSERIARQQMHQHAVDAVNGALGSMAPGKRQVLVGLLGAGAQVGSLAYDRQQESEADHIGIFLMTFADFDPAQAITFWGKMEQLSRGKSRPEIVSDHPSDARRIAQIRQWVPHARAAKSAWSAGRTIQPQKDKVEE